MGICNARCTRQPSRRGNLGENLRVGKVYLCECIYRWRWVDIERGTVYV